jgi:hypothetical protein
MNFRNIEYQELNIDARWLTPENAKNAYGYAILFSDKTRYGLCRETVADIERLEIASQAIADAWLASRFRAEGSVQIFFGGGEACVLTAADFVARWRSLFLPSRDDAMILHNANKSILFYCHEDELEFGFRTI